MIAAGQEGVVELVGADGPDDPDDPADRGGQQLVTGPVVGGLHLRGGAAEVVRAVVPGHPGEKRIHPGLEGVVLVDVVGVPDPGGIDGAVQDHAADVAGEQGGVHLAEVGGPGEPVVVDLRHAERRADGVKVSGHVLGGHVGKQPAEPSLAVAGVHLGPADEHLLGGGAGRHVVRPRAGEEARITAQRGNGRPGAARVETDDVVVPGHARAQALGQDRRPRQPAGTGAARVDQNDPLLLAPRGGRGDHVQRDADMPATGVGVVQRHAQRGAVGRVQLRRAGMPVQRAGGGDDRPGALGAPSRLRAPGGRSRLRAPGGRARRRGGRGAGGAGGDREQRSRDRGQRHHDPASGRPWPARAGHRGGSHDHPSCPTKPDAPSASHNRTRNRTRSPSV